MRDEIDLGEVITAMVTPWKGDDKQGIAFDEVKNLVDYLGKNGTTTYLVNGSTGESAHMTPQEWEENIRCIRACAPIGKKVMVSISSQQTGDAIAKAQKAFELGADAILVSAPAYTKPSKQALFIYFNSIAKAIKGKPMMIYNIPGRTAKEIPPTTVAQLAHENPNIIGIKQSMPDMDKVSQLKRLCPPDFQLYSGDDSLTLPMLALGAKGVVSVMSHLEGKKIQSMIRAFKNGMVPLAQSYHYMLYPLFSRVSMHDKENGDDYANPLPIKEALYQRGLISSPRASTLGEMSAYSKQEMQDVLAQVQKSTQSFDSKNAAFLCQCRSL